MEFVRSQTWRCIFRNHFSKYFLCFYYVAGFLFQYRCKRYILRVFSSSILSSNADILISIFSTSFFKGIRSGLRSVSLKLFFFALKKIMKGLQLMWLFESEIYCSFVVDCDVIVYIFSNLSRELFIVFEAPFHVVLPSPGHQSFLLLKLYYHIGVLSRVLVSPYLPILVLTYALSSLEPKENSPICT